MVCFIGNYFLYFVSFSTTSRNRSDSKSFILGVSFNAGSAGNCQRPSPVSTPAPPVTESTTWSDGNGDNHPTRPTQQQNPTTTSSTTTTTTASETATTTTAEKPTTTTGGSSTTPGQGGIINGQFCTEENEYYADPSNCQKYFR